MEAGGGAGLVGGRGGFEVVEDAVDGLGDPGGAAGGIEAGLQGLDGGAPAAQA